MALTTKEVDGNLDKMASGAMRGDKCQSSEGTCTSDNSSSSTVVKLLTQVSILPIFSSSQGSATNAPGKSAVDGSKFGPR